MPQQEQDIINFFVKNPTQENAMLQELLNTVNPNNVPIDFVSALRGDANANRALGALYGRPSDLNALVDVHQPIFSADPLSVTMTENGGKLTQTGTISFFDTNSMLSPTASVTANTVTATGDGLTLTDAQKMAFANAFTITDPKTGAWSFDLEAADSAFLIPGDSVRIVETVTVDDGHGGTATQDEAFTILGSNEPPTITSGGGGSAATYIINEGTRFITDVTASDPDRGDQITYSIVGDSKKTGFIIDAQTGALSLKHSLDDEHGDKQSAVTVGATDSFGASATQAITVKEAHDHLMIGTSAADTFVFQPHFGFEVVENFDPSNDALQFYDTIFANAQDVLAHAKQVRDDVVITTPFPDPHGKASDDWTDGHGHDTIILKDVQLASLHADDFKFVTPPAPTAALSQLAQLTQAVASFSPTGVGSVTRAISQASNDVFGQTHELANPH